MKSQVYYLSRYLDRLQADAYEVADDLGISAEDAAEEIEADLAEMEEVEDLLDRS